MTGLETANLAPLLIELNPKYNNLKVNQARLEEFINENPETLEMILN